MEPISKPTARPGRIAVTNLNNTLPLPSASGTTAAPAPATAEQAERARDAEQQHLYQLEQLAFNTLTKCELEVGRALIRDGAAALDDNPAHFDSAGRSPPAVLMRLSRAAWQECGHNSGPLCTISAI
jgi:hypothetical protein